MSFIYIVFFIPVQYLRTMEIEISLINSYLAFCFLLFSMTTLSQLGVCMYIMYVFLYSPIDEILVHHNVDPIIYQMILYTFINYKLQTSDLQSKFTAT